MFDFMKVASIVTVGVVTILSFVLVPESAQLHDKLTYGLLSLAGLYGVGAGAKYAINTIRGR